MRKLFDTTYTVILERLNSKKHKFFKVYLAANEARKTWDYMIHQQHTQL